MRSVNEWESNKRMVDEPFAYARRLYFVVFVPAFVTVGIASLSGETMAKLKEYF